MRKKEPKSKQKKITETKILVGRYYLGFRVVDLYIDPNKKYGAEFCLCPVEKENPYIIVGKDKNLTSAYCNLTHEVFEACMSDMGVIFVKSDLFEPGKSDGAYFFFRHEEYTEIASKAGYFLLMCSEPFKKAYNKIIK